MSKELSGYELSRAWFDFSFENPEKISPNHAAIYFFAIEHCNRMGWKEKFGFPTQMAMDAIGIKKHGTYIKYFNDLCEWGFLKLVQKSANQYSANIISLLSAKPKNGKALDKAILNHAAKQTQSNGQSTGQSTGQSNGSIDKPNNQEPITTKPDFSNMPVPEMCGEVPDEVIKDCVIDFAVREYQTIQEWQARDLWPGFLRQHVTGKKYYQDIEAVYSHFKNWIKNQKFKEAPENKPEPRKSQLSHLPPNEWN